MKNLHVAETMFYVLCKRGYFLSIIILYVSCDRYTYLIAYQLMSWKNLSLCLHLQDILALTKELNFVQG